MKDILYLAYFLWPSKYLSKFKYYLNQIAFFLLGCWLLGCSDFVEVDSPKNILISETVFNDPATVESALANIYYKLRDQGMVSGNFGLTTLMGIYADELDYYGTNHSYHEFYNHTVANENSILLSWWNHAYHLIYASNDILKGLEASHNIPFEKRESLTGQTLFIRAYIHSHLVSLFGEIPYITSTDYLKNQEISRTAESEVYEHIIADLRNAIDFLKNTENKVGERVIPDQNTAKALLARIYLYTEKWDLASSLATEVIEAYAIEPNLDDVFLKTSQETIWQLKPGVNPKNTQEANQLIIQGIPGQNYALSESLLSNFENGDLRYINWIGTKSNTDNDVTLKYAHKYKLLFHEMESLEYSILFRLAEQYLIRAETMAKLGNFARAQQDLNVIRNRAGLSNTTANSLNEILDAILQERQVELFSEHGHRWFDLKRTGKAPEVLSVLKSNWEHYNLLFPIPEKELSINPNLLPQNNGY
ncbi:RagB/SusD family nutrient uptake outer membrane protein [Gelidibacter maritimus]|uniref:RagB/SusD family nutrient uptake outer membrane protein n=1 Tax=Gelidibacter maritimus TaxID=2761487 RepID=A0A7W2M6J5_9FLAO|nr:RagB/SusD family nutrient uptake outer membrane protein [Gelidibacter maritimus]MBA6153411.1 RagB/SusD family nutrient uptake outer membrane protein [Gelidibacter maritimus]